MPFPRWSRKRSRASRHAETIRAVAAAVDARDADGYVSHMTEDVVVTPPGFLMGCSKLRGHGQVMAAFAELSGALDHDGRRLEVTNRQYFVDQADENRLLMVDELTICGARTIGTEAALLFTMARDGRVSRLESWSSEAEGLAQLQDPLAIDV